MIMHYYTGKACLKSYIKILIPVRMLTCIETKCCLCASKLYSQYFSGIRKKFLRKNQLFLNFSLQPQRGMKKIRTNRKQLSIQRNILPKQPMVTVLRPSGQQPLSIPVCPQMGLVSVPNNMRLQPKTITTTGQH